MALDDETLRQRLSGQRWTAMNLQLSDAVWTRPGHGDFLADDPRLASAHAVLDLLFGRDLTGVRIADLGALEGGVALAMARRGASVVGIEVRPANVEKLRLIEEHFALPNLSFVQDDVKNFARERYGTFDAVLALGILYHLDDPVQWLRQVAGATTDLLFLDTHYAPLEQVELDRLAGMGVRLTDLEEISVDGATYEGRWFVEFPEGTDSAENLWASYSNYRSFWLTRASLAKALLAAGFEIVLHDEVYGLHVRPWLSAPAARGLFACFPAGRSHRRRADGGTARGVPCPA